MISRLRSFFKKLFLRPDTRTSRRITGDAGEKVAESFFKKAGYKVLARNWRAGRDEIDLVLLDPASRTPVFVEVKTRAANDLRGGYFAVDERKKAALRRAVRAYLLAVGSPASGHRFDIAEVRVGADGETSVIHHCAIPLFSK